MFTKIALLATFILTTLTSFSQQTQRRTIEERVKDVMEKMKEPLKLDELQAKKTDSVFTQFYKVQQKMMEDSRASGERPDRSVFEKMTTDRDDKLKAIFSAEQFTKFKNEVEATLRPQRRSN